MTGSKYSGDIAQLEDHEALHLDAHIFSKKMLEEQPDIITAIMTQILLKSVLKEWGTKVHNDVNSGMKQPHFRNMFKPLHWKELDNTQRNSILESHMFLKQKRYGEIKGQTVDGGNKQRN